MNLAELVVEAKTLDLVLDTYSREDILRLFLETRTAATKLDAARDRLRKYVQDKIPAGQYGKVIMTFKNGGARTYANSEGLGALQVYGIVKPTEVLPELRPLAGQSVTIRNDKGEIFFRGTLVDNSTLYTESESRTITVTILPEVI